MTVAQDARAVLLPILDSFELTAEVRDYYDGGGVSCVLASSAEEYNARRISDSRRATEHWWDVRSFTASLSGRAGRPLIFAADAEPTGVQRLEHLLPPLPPRDEALRLEADELCEVYERYARAARWLGINLFLAPVADEITGRNEWLQGRTLSHDQDTVERVTGAFVRGATAAGMATTVKHFPGFSDLEAHPVTHDVTLKTELAELERQGRPFRSLIERGAPAVMVGPAMVEAYDPVQPAGTSSVLVDLLRNDYGFAGLIVSDDLDALSTLKGRSLEDTVIASVRAGVELLLIPGGSHIAASAVALEAAASEDEDLANRLAAAATHVRDIAERWPSR